MFPGCDFRIIRALGLVNAHVREIRHSSAWWRRALVRLFDGVASIAGGAAGAVLVGIGCAGEATDSVRCSTRREQRAEVRFALRRASYWRIAQDAHLGLLVSTL